MAKSPSLSNLTALRDETVLRRVRHFGSARNGLQEWRLQRLTAIALIPLGLYFAASMLRLATSDQVTAAAWLASPVAALLVILFQSWIDPFIIMIAVPGALVGILWMLAVTGSTINVESLMGSIMAVGIATSNSILLVSYANDARVERGMSPLEAALEAGKTRLRPVLMTALAMIIGMVPMAIGLGEGGEQNAPLGRAVIGGLLFATFATLFFVPCVFSIIHGRLERRRLHGATPQPAAS